MKLTMLAKDEGSGKNGCPSCYLDEDGAFVVQGDELDADTAADLVNVLPRRDRRPDQGQRDRSRGGEVPEQPMTDTLLPPGSPILLNRFREFRYSVYRLETLQEYGNSGEDAALTAFLDGDPDPPPDPSDDEWAAMIGENVAAGRTVQRVHVIVEPLTDYMRFELTWAYGRNAAAGEDIRIIPVRGDDWPDDLPPRGTDYWLFDSREVFEQQYADDGTWLGSRQITDPARVVSACAWRDVALHLGTPWRTYIGSRPELRDRLGRSTVMSVS